MTDPSLISFIRESLALGKSREELGRVLREAGWPKDQIETALSAFAVVDFPVPVPKPKSQLSARDAYMYLVMFSMLYLTAYNFGSLMFQFIDSVFPDPLNARYGDAIGGKIRWATSSLLVAFPIFVFVASRISKGIRLDPSQRTSGVRKWLTYITLSLAACIIVGDLIVVINSLLSGSLTLRFVLKALTITLIAGSVFGYYLQLMRADDAALKE